MKEGEPVLGGNQAAPGGFQSSNFGTQQNSSDELKISHPRPEFIPNPEPSPTPIPPSSMNAQPSTPVAPQPPRLNFGSTTNPLSVSASRPATSIPPMPAATTTQAPPRFTNQSDNTVPKPTSTINNATISSATFQSQPIPSSTGDITLSTTKKKKPFAKILAIILPILITVGGVGVFLLIQNANRQDFIAKANALVDALSWTSYSNQCLDVVYDFDNVYTTASDFENYINDCKKNTAEIQSLMADLKDRDSSPEYTEIYNSLSAAINDKLVTGENLEYSLKLYSIWHSWLLNTNLMDPILTEDDRQALIAPLLESGNEYLANYATEWAELQRQTTEAYTIASIYDFDPEYMDAYNAAYKEQMYWERDNRPDWDTLVLLNREDMDYYELYSLLMSFDSYIKEQYEK